MTTPPEPPNPGTPGPDEGAAYPPPQGSTPPPGAYPPPGSNPPPPGAYPPPPAGAYPPPGSNPPPPGAYPPPPAGYGPGDQGPGYGAPAGYGAPGFAPQQQFSVGDAISYGWNRFKDNVGPWIGIVLAFWVINAILQVISNTSSRDGGWVIPFIVGIISILVGYLFSAAFIRGALDENEARKPGFGAFFAFRNYGPIIATALLVAIGTIVGLIIVIIPGIIFAFLTYWALTFVVDKQLDPISGIKESFSIISKNVGPLLLLALASIGLNIVGAILCGLGLLVTIPVTTIASVYAYRFFTGGQIAPLNAAPAGGQYPPQY
ncbi:hypothetical protein [Gordonia soli]|uniref:Proline rich protein n=1 Tax=Gordonia soli NBRC 108243 TaxID=1223545 RepID=M0QQE6_9ACTN|nr:hypothetical protein [Gordonia soli]GAC70624.1 hypothetical protein GS4_38_00300 [Gordonia soli NBRC 108243]